MEEFESLANPEKFKPKFENQNIMYNQEEIEELFQMDEDKFKSSYDDPSIEKTIHIYRPEYLFNVTSSLSLFMGQKELNDCDVLIPEEAVFVENTLSGYTTKPINGFHIEIKDMCEEDKIEKARKRAIVNMESISSMGFVLSKDFTQESMRYDYSQNKFYFTSLETLQYKKDTISIEKTTTENVKRLQKILT